eukprot:scaffold8907_cov105-Isochrysis_galbana.AAC.6
MASLATALTVWVSPVSPAMAGLNSTFDACSVTVIWKSGCTSVLASPLMARDSSCSDRLTVRRSAFSTDASSPCTNLRHSRCTSSPSFLNHGPDHGVVRGLVGLEERLTVDRLLLERHQRGGADGPADLVGQPLGLLEVGHQPRHLLSHPPHVLDEDVDHLLSRPGELVQPGPHLLLQHAVALAVAGDVGGGIRDLEAQVAPAPHLHEELQQPPVEVGLDEAVDVEEAAHAGLDRDDPLRVHLADVLIERRVQLGVLGRGRLGLARRAQVGASRLQLLPLPRHAPVERPGPQRGAGVLWVVAVHERRRALELVKRLLDA